MPSIDDLFPPAPRVIYRDNPLSNVVCQIRFPTLLRIEAYPPVELQEAIRANFPLVERAVNPALQNLPQELVQAMGAPSGATTYIFRTETKGVWATLSSDALTIETNAYREWEEFWNLAAACIKSLEAIYLPSFITRAGLRYQNLIHRGRIGADGIPWSDLLSANILGELAEPSWEATAVDSRRVIRCVDTNGDALLLQHGFAQSGDDNEQVYLIDFDYYRDGHIACGDSPNVFEHFHARSGRAFRWAISDRLHAILGPDEGRGS